MPFRIETTTTWVRKNMDAFGLNSPVLEHLVGTTRLVGADRFAAFEETLSNDLSNFTIDLAPLGASAVGRLMYFSTDQPVDVRLGASDATILSAVRQLVLGANFSSLFITTASQATKVFLRVVGGSNASLEASVPSP